MDVKKINHLNSKAYISSFGDSKTAIVIGNETDRLTLYLNDLFVKKVKLNKDLDEISVNKSSLPDTIDNKSIDKYFNSLCENNKALDNQIEKTKRILKILRVK